MRPRVFRVRLNGERYRIIHTSLDDAYGRVDYDIKKISIDPDMATKSNEAMAEILLHEALHVLIPNWKEMKVLRAGKDLARMLVTAGLINEKETKD